MAELEEVLFTRLTTVSGVQSLVASRVYPMRAVQNPTLPYLTYQRVSAERATAMGSDPGVSAVRVQVDAWAATYAGAVALGTQVRLALERWRNALSSPVVLDSFIERDEDIDPLEDVDVQRQDLFRRSLDFVIWHREAVS